MAHGITRARSAKQAARECLAEIPGLVGIGLTRVGDAWAIKVNLSQELPRGVKMPRRIEGVAVVVEVVGPVRKRR